MARALAYRWQVPSEHRGQYTNWRRIRHRTLPPEPRWADDWQPTTAHRAELVITVNRNVIRFAASQMPVRPLTGGGPLSVPSGPNTPRRFAVFKYDVTETGEVRPGSFEILDSSDRDFERAIRDQIERQRFQPATQNCRSVAMTVVQRAGT